MRSQSEIDAILHEVQAKLDTNGRATGLALKVPPGGYDEHDGWLSVIVAPVQAGVRAYDYVLAIGSVERDLRASGHQQVLLVPAMAD